VFFSREPGARPCVPSALADARVRFVPQPSDEELVILLNLAAVFVLPSWYEGFGLPLVEAMQCGTPVIGSTRGSIPEVIGDAGLLFEVEEPRQLAHALRLVLRDGSVRSLLSEQARRRAALFSWERAARETLDVYQQVLRSKPRPVPIGVHGGRGAMQDSVRG
jgi:glycosyltransferase involved in cell wall biosynthesis